MINLRVHKQLHHIYESTSPKSLSSSILLNADLRSRDVDYITSDWRIQLAYNVEFLKKQKKKYQVLNCSYCPKENLFINEDFTRQPETEFLATVDHIVPISKGGDKLSYDNLTGACWDCNNKKKNLIGYKIGENKYSYKKK